MYHWDGKTTKCWEKHWKFSNLILVIIHVSDKKPVKAMLKFVFVLELKCMPLLFIIVLS